MAIYTDDDLTNLRSIIASGVKSVVFDNKRIDYASLDDLLKATEIVGSGTAVTPDPTTGLVPVRTRQLRVFSCKGF